MNTQKTRKGFTLIELLIVIGLLGTLAVALLAAIDPFEQFKKGSDTGVRNTVQEFYNASIRYYAQKSGWPSEWGITDTTTVFDKNFSDTSVQTAMIGPLMIAGELKSNFIDLASGQLQNITASIQGTKLLVCFHPESKGVMIDKNVRYRATNFSAQGVPSTDTANACPTNGGTDSASCYWCIY